MSRPSSLTMCTRTLDCRCHEHVRHIAPPKRSYAQRRMSSADMSSSSDSGSGGAVAKQHLLQGVAAEAEAERLERDHLVGRDVAEVDVGAEVLHEPRLRR